MFVCYGGHCSLKINSVLLKEPLADFGGTLGSHRTLVGKGCCRHWNICECIFGNGISCTFT